MKEILRSITKSLATIFIKIFFRVEEIGSENVPKEGKAILCSNHIHDIDGPLMCLTAKRGISIIAKEELWDNKVFAYFLDMFDTISVNREKPKMSTFKKIKKVMENNKLLGVFIEGTKHGLAKGLDVKDGAASFAIKYNAPVVPIKLVGNYRVFSTVKMIYGKPLVLEKNTNVKEGTKQIMHAIDSLKEPLSRQKKLVKTL